MLRIAKQIGKYLILIGLGVITSLTILEISLQLMSFGLQTFKSSENRHEKLLTDHLRILTIGESTTEGFGTHTWPDQLQEVLSKRRPDIKVQVINRGITSTDSATIANQLPEWLQQFQPQIVVSMMGINDKSNILVMKPMEDSHAIYKILNNSRSFKFIRALWKTFEAQAGPLPDTMNKCSNKKLFAQLKSTIESNSPISAKPQEENLIALKEECLATHDIKSSKFVYEKLIKLYPKDIYFSELAELWMRPDGSDEKALKILDSAIAFNPNYSDFYLIRSRVYQNVSKELSLESLLKAIELAPKNQILYEHLRLRIRDYKLPPEQYRARFESLPLQADNDCEAYLILADFYRITKEPKLTEESLIKATRSLKATDYSFDVLARHYAEQQNFNLERYTYREGRKLHPESTSLISGLALSYFHTREFDSAIETMALLREVQEPAEHEPKSFSIQQRAASRIVVMVSQQKLSEKNSSTLNDFLIHIGLSSDAGLSYTKHHYQRVKDEVNKQGSKLFAMQYPLLPLEALKETLNYDNSVAFISNQNNFEAALKAHPYDYVFTDRFAGTFGHLTDFGNGMIAENAANAILPYISDSPHTLDNRRQ